MNDVMRDYKWTCKLCEASGFGGIINYSRHYKDAHKQLEMERYRVI
jgi:hypothetical protein